MEMWLEAAQEFESEVKDWLKEVPPEFRMPVEDPDSSPVRPTINSLPTPTEVAEQYLSAQRCELAAFAKSLILKAYTPLLRKHSTKPGAATHVRTAQLACADAAHGIIEACYGLFKAFGASRPCSYVFYSFGRQVFAAAAISASIVIQSYDSLVAKPAMQDLERALALMRDPIIASARGHFHGPTASSSSGGSGVGGESLHIVELLYAKALEALGRPSNGSGSHVGTKRKHREIDAIIPAGFTIPFVGGSLATGPPVTPAVPATQATAPHAPPPKTRLRSSTVSAKRGTGSTTTPLEASEPSPTRQTRFSPGSTDIPPASAGAAPALSSPGPNTSPIQAAAAGKRGSSKDRRKTSMYPSVGVRKRPKATNSGVSSSTASRSQAGDLSSDAASSTYASSVRGPPSVSGGGETTGGQSEAGSVRSVSIKKHPGLPSVSTSSYSDSPYPPPPSLPFVGEVHTAATPSSASTPILQQQVSATGFAPIQSGPIHQVASGPNSFMQRAPTVMPVVGGGYLAPSAAPSTSNSPTERAAFIDTNAPYLNDTLSAPPHHHTETLEHHQHAQDILVASGSHSMGMTHSVSNQSAHSSHQPQLQTYTGHSNFHHHHQQDAHMDISQAQVHQSRPYGSQGYNSFMNPPSQLPGGMDPSVSAYYSRIPPTSNGHTNGDMKPSFPHQLGGPSGLHSAPPPPVPAPWENYHPTYPPDSSTSRGNVNGNNGNEIGSPNGNAYAAHESQQGQGQGGQQRQSSYYNASQGYSTNW